MTDVVIIGAGIAGTCIARELSRYNIKIVIVDRENDVANETSMANSAIIHAGYDAKAGYKKGEFNAKGNEMFDVICDELDIPFKRCGSLVIGFDENDVKTIEELYDNGVKNNVPDMKILSKEEVKEMEPNLSDNVCCALYAPTAGIISPWELGIAMAENAIDNGAELKLETTVLDIKKHEDYYSVITDKGNVDTKYVINCAGVFADKISNMVTEPYFKIRPKKGNYLVFDKEVGDVVSHVIFQCPTEKGKGILITPTVHGNLLMGPDAEFIDDKEDLSTEAKALEYVQEISLLTSKKVPFNKVIRSFAGLRPSSDIGDFIIEEVSDAKGFINVAGYESPGLSSIPAVTTYVVNILKEIAGGFEVNEKFNPYRKKVIRFMELDEDEKAEIIRKDSRYGKVICRCEGVTEGEILDCIHRNAGARSLKAVKKRTRSGMGRCQGGFCGPRVVEILARELGKDMNEIPYDSSRAYILTEETKNCE